MIAANALRLPYANGSAHMAATSPPYAYKRRYSGVDPTEWPEVTYQPMPGLPAVVVPAVTAEQIAETPEQVEHRETREAIAAELRITGGRPGPYVEALFVLVVVAALAGGRVRLERPPNTPGQDAGILGLEPDPLAYIGHLVLIFREAWRVLRDDGVLAVNIGDSFAGSHMTGGRENSGISSSSRRHGPQWLAGRETTTGTGYPAKCLMGIPWRLAFALIADGWTLRSRLPGGVEADLVPDVIGLRPDVIWRKNAMPESVRDRPSVDFEDVFIFSKKRAYFWDQENGREPLSETPGARWWRENFDPAKQAGEMALKASGMKGGNDGERRTNPAGANMRASWRITTEPTSEKHYACVDEGVEILTARGWKRHDELIPWERIAEYQIEDGSVGWGHLCDVHRYRLQDEPVTRMLLTKTEVLMTKNHRAVVQVRSSRRGEWTPPRFREAAALKKGDAVVVSGPWRGAVGMPIDATMAELLGWYVAEGHERDQRDGTVDIYQSVTANPEKTARIEECLRILGARYRRVERHRVAGESLSEHTEARFAIKGPVAWMLRHLAPGKALQWFVLDWHPDLLEALLCGLIEGDGHTRADGRRCFIQKSKACSDLVQAIAIRLGYSSRMIQHPEGGWYTHLSKKRQISLRGTNSSGSNAAGPTLSEVRHTGLVWCPETESGAWVARKDGRVFITGNSWPRELVRKLIRIGTSDKGCCPECGAQWRRETERVGGRLARDTGLDTVPTACGVRDASSGASTLRGAARRAIRGWAPSCSCDAGDPVPCSVLDPFSGIGRTGEVCFEEGRRYMPAELSIGYAAIQRRRLEELRPAAEAALEKRRAAAAGKVLGRGKAAPIEGPLLEGLP